MEPKAFRLPIYLTSRADITRLVRELESLESYFLGSAVRHNPTEQPRVSRLLNELVRDNQVNLLESKERGALKQNLQNLLSNAPNLHVSFASDPSPKVVGTILTWLRQNIHPQSLIVVGLQPDIAAGMVLRTPNKIFDMSLRTYLKKQETYLVELIGDVANG